MSSAFRNLPVVRGLYGADEVAGAGSGKNNAFGASLHYPLSKRTRLYGEFMNGKLRNAAGTAEQKDTNYGVGLIHNF